MNVQNQVFLLLCHSVSAEVIGEYKKILRATESLGDAYLLYNMKKDEMPPELNKYKHYTFSQNSLSTFKYPMLGHSFIRGHEHFPLLQFFHDNSEIDYYWIIEYDVRFSGNWRKFFEFFSNINKDFISCHICSYNDEPFWGSWSLSHPEKSIPNNNKLRSFNPIYRISKQALSFLHQAMQDGWCGHFEVLIPTLLYNNGFQIMDFGGVGRFVSPDMMNKFYTSSPPNKHGLLIEGTMRFRPLFFAYGGQKNKLYHPVKPEYRPQDLYHKLFIIS